MSSSNYKIGPLKYLFTLVNTTSERATKPLIYWLINKYISVLYFTVQDSERILGIWEKITRCYILETRKIYLY